MRASNEQEVLLHMEKHLDSFGGKIGAVNPLWTAKKRLALDGLNPSEIIHVMDVGLGDMSHVAGWRPFVEREILYAGIDGSQRILDLAKEKFPETQDRIYVQSTVGELVDGEFPEEPVDLVICLDVLYHIPSDALYERFLKWLALYAEKYLLVSCARSTEAPDAGRAKKAGDPGFAWFPRLFVSPSGFDVIYEDDNRGCGQPQKQELLLLRRADY